MPDEQLGFWMDDEPENLTFDSQKYINDLVKEELKAGNFTIEGADPDMLDDIKFLVKQGLEEDIDPFESTESEEARQAALDRMAARKAGHKFTGGEIGFQAFTPLTKSANEMVQNWSEFGDAEKTGGTPKVKKKTVNDRLLIEAYLKELWPDAIEIRYEETWQTSFNGMRFKVDRDGFIDFSIQFLTRGEIAIQATTVGAESAHLKKMSTRKRKAGDNVHRWLKSGRELYMVLTDEAPGSKPKILEWETVGKFKRVICHYEITAEILQASRDRREKLAASKAEKFKKRKL